MTRTLFASTILMGLTMCHGASPSEPMDHAALIKRMPPELLDRAGGAYPDKNGMVGHNRDGFKAAAFQRGATLKLAIHAAQGDREKANDCWRAVDAAFQHQKPEGHFGDPPTSVAFWLCELNRALLVVSQSPLAKEFKDRIEQLKPKVRLAADWLMTQEARLMKEDAQAPNRLFFDAEALLFSSKVIGDAKYLKPGQRFLEAGMKLYRAEDGVFLEHGGGDSSYQAVNLLRLQEIVIHFPNAKIEDAIARGIQWELGRVGPDGKINTENNTRVRPGGEAFMGKEKQVNVGEIALAMLYHHARTGDENALKAVRRIAAAR